MIFCSKALTAGLLVALSTKSSAQECPILSFSDEFNGDALNEDVWSPQVGDGCDQGTDLCGWGNAEPQYYRGTDGTNIEVSAGSLKITAREESFGDSPYTSARIRTMDKAEFDLTQDTLIEARIKVPDGGNGIWPAFWMLPSPAVTWPMGGEIDIMEFIGREPFNGHGYAHYGAAFGDKTEVGGPMKFPEPLFEDYHVFSILKTANRIAWMIDGYEYQSYTPDDIVPKYSWPFENTYHIILNVAAGGLWPGYADETSIFPTTMEVDYVRVFDMSGGKTVPLIDGTRLVHSGRRNMEYCVLNVAAGANITWDVPEGASFLESENENCIVVDFGSNSGYVRASIASTCVPEGAYDLSVPVEVQPFYGVDYTILNSGNLPSFTTGNSNATVLEGLWTLEYGRNQDELFDYIQIDTDIADLEDFLTGERRFFMDVKTTTSAPCTAFLVQLEDTSLATPDNYPTGRHSRYQCLLEPTRDWQRIACDFMDRPDRSVINVDTVSVVVDPSLGRSDFYYIRTIDVAAAGCTTSCESLRNNGPATNNCRRRAKSEAGACGDGFNNDFFDYDGNEVTDCDDPDCFLLDPLCGGPGGEIPQMTPIPMPPGFTLPPTVAFEDEGDEETVAPPAGEMPEQAASTPPPTVADADEDETVDSDTEEPPETIDENFTPAPTPTDLFVEFTECSLNPACVGLDNDCCPTVDGVFLTCCFEADPINGTAYVREFTLIGPQRGDQQAEYLASTANYFDPATSPDGRYPSVGYRRNRQEMYDLIYFKTDSITSPDDYVSGRKKFFIDIYSRANACVQVLVQLDALPIASENEYPIGRHSRYSAFTTTTNEWERLEFNFVDRPDEELADSEVDSVVLFFNPGVPSDDIYFFRNLDSAVEGCDPEVSECEDVGPKSCPAQFRGEAGMCDDGLDNDNDGQVDCEDSDCTSDPVCATTVSRSYATAKSMLRVDGDVEGTASISDGSGSSSLLSMGFVFMIPLLATGFLNAISA